MRKHINHGKEVVSVYGVAFLNVLNVSGFNEILELHIDNSPI